ncbi:MAG: DNA cytosine methyltransferase [Albidovulum sp.]|nr:DNA cytosine methyltransferase [Albidovulum sp.]
MSGKYTVIDLFAGPGGLGEGFSEHRTLDGHRPFNIALSVENNKAAWRTLRLRAFLRRFGDEFPPRYYKFLADGGTEPDWGKLHPAEWQAACSEVQLQTLGTPEAAAALQPVLAKLAGERRLGTVVIGGPPCQAYSLVGRARNRGVPTYDPAKDKRHFLYSEYILILKKLQPAAFVMENVKGMLSASVKGQAIFEQILNDLRKCGSNGNYVLLPFDTRSKPGTDLHANWKPQDFIVRSERFGVPQSRHRVIIIGLHHDLAANLPTRSWSPECLERTELASVENVLRSLPHLRSGLSRSTDNSDAWRVVVDRAMTQVCKVMSNSNEPGADKVHKRACELLTYFRLVGHELPRKSRHYRNERGNCPQALHDWLVDPHLKGLANHESRSHMPRDLARYFFASVHAEIHGRSPNASAFPAELAPNHRNWSTGKFADRFRAQPWSSPSSTVTSHIAKDGHYYIHPDPLQCRSLTVREAARLQTFPDNYMFAGNRTEQYVQVGNAVPPFLARQVAAFVHSLLSESAFTSNGQTKPIEAVAAE